MFFSVIDDNSKATSFNTDHTLCHDWLLLQKNLQLRQYFFDMKQTDTNSIILAPQNLKVNLVGENWDSTNYCKVENYRMVFLLLGNECHFTFIVTSPLCSWRSRHSKTSFIRALPSGHLQTWKVGGVMMVSVFDGSNYIEFHAWHCTSPTASFTVEH